MFGNFFKVAETIETVVLSTKEYNELIERLDQAEKELISLKEGAIDDRGTEDS